MVKTRWFKRHERRCSTGQKPWCVLPVDHPRCKWIYRYIYIYTLPLLCIVVVRLLVFFFAEASCSRTSSTTNFCLHLPSLHPTHERSNIDVENQTYTERNIGSTSKKQFESTTNKSKIEEIALLELLAASSFSQQPPTDYWLLTTDYWLPIIQNIYKLFSVHICITMYHLLQ